MAANSSGLWDDRDDRPEHNDDQPRGYRVEDDNNLEEKDLKTKYLFGDGKMKNADAPGMEGHPEGGQKFGQENLTPSGNDEGNPPQNAKDNNPYFKRKEPSEEHPENSNFRSKEQSGSPDYQQVKPKNEGGESGKKQQEQAQQEDQNTYQEGTADNDGQTNIPGPNELPDQQKVGEDNDGKRGDGKYHVET